MPTWSGTVDRTPDRRYAAALRVDASDGRGAGLYITGEHVVYESTSARELGRIPYRHVGDDAPTRLDLSVEAGRLVARSIATHYDGSDALLETRALELPPASPPAAVPAEPHLLFELAEPAGDDAIVLAVDAIRGRLVAHDRDPASRRDRDPRTVRLVEGDRIAVVLAGEREEDVLARLELDRPAIVSAPPLDLLVESVSPWSARETLELTVRVSWTGAPPPRVDVLLDGAVRGSLATPRAPGALVPARLRIDPAESDALVRCACFPLGAPIRLVPA